jgi:hypothetical protein
MNIYYDNSYCSGKNLKSCQNCIWNLNLYSYSGNRDIWHFEPEIIGDSCVDYGFIGKKL